MLFYTVNFDLENLKKLESKAEQLELDVKQLEAQKAELEAVEADKKLQQIRDREARIEEKQWKKKKRKEELARKREILKNEEPERSFFARDHEGRNGIHKIGGFTFYAMIVMGLETLKTTDSESSLSAANQRSHRCLSPIFGVDPKN